MVSRDSLGHPRKPQKLEKQVLLDASCGKGIVPKALQFLRTPRIPTVGIPDEEVLTASGLGLVIIFPYDLYQITTPCHMFHLLNSLKERDSNPRDS